MNRVYFFSLFCLLTLSGCLSTSALVLDIHSTSREVPTKNRRFIIFPNLTTVSTDDYLFPAYATQVEQALLMNGYEKAQGPDQADIAILLDYGISKPHLHREIVSIPIWAPTGITQSDTEGTITTTNDGATFSSTTTHKPFYTITGVSEHTRTRKYYTKHITLMAVDLIENNLLTVNKPVWRTHISSSSVHGDLRQVFPLLLDAAMRNIAKNTQKRLQISAKLSNIH